MVSGPLAGDDLGGGFSREESVVGTEKGRHSCGSHPHQPRQHPRGCADATPRKLDMNIVSETGYIKNDNAFLLQQGNLMSPRDRISNSSAKNQ